MQVLQALPAKLLAGRPTKAGSDLPASIEWAANGMGAYHCRSFESARYNLDADANSVRAYLGTYFPRTVFEFMTIGRDMLGLASMRKAVPATRPLRVLDLGSGTGGAWLGLAAALIEDGFDQGLHIHALDGNLLALSKQSALAHAFSSETDVGIELATTHCVLGSDVESFSRDLARILATLDERYDFVLVSKHLSEMYCAAGNAAHGVVYEALRLLSTVLADNGFLIMLDLTTRIDEVGQFFPNLMARELGAYLNSHPDGMQPVLPVPCALSAQGGCVGGKGGCYTQRKLHFRHAIGCRGYLRDESTKVAYRVMAHPSLARSVSAGYATGLAYQVNACREEQACHQGRILTHVQSRNGYIPLLNRSN